MKCITKNNSNPKGKPKVYFTSHPHDVELYVKKISDDVFKTHDCAIYYTESIGGEAASQNLDLDLGAHNLFVIPVTRALLTTPNRAIDVDLPYALKEHIPILPIMMEAGIDHLYSKEDKFGELQYLNAVSTDSSEISYQDKLKKFLDSVLISDELANRVRAAFDAYIFLSYRKKDRKYANELMRMIHRNSEFRDIAIWYDEFLIPGESFSDNIMKIMGDSKLFALLVTPNLLEEPNGAPNYVMGQEYPAALTIGLPIVPAEMEATDKDKLKEKFSQMPECVNPYEECQFKEVLLKSLSRIAVRENDQNPTHNFLIGLAYLEGIDVEIDRTKGVSIIESVADGGLEEAIRKMVSIYVMGAGVSKSYFHARDWFKKLLLQKEAQSESAEGMISFMEVCDEYCDFLLKYFLVEYSCFVNDEMLPCAKAYVDKTSSVYSDERQNAMLFWLCKSYYRSVHADMVRDADDHNAERYGELIKSYRPFIKSEDHICIINECLEYIEKAKCFWAEFDKVISANKKNEAKSQKEESIDDMLRLVAKCENEYNASPCEETVEELAEAYSNVMYYYKKRCDPVNYPKYAVSYLTIKTDQFRSDPDVLEELDIVCCYDDLVDFLIKNERLEDAISVIKEYIVFLEYLLEIGSECEVDYFEAYAKLSSLYKEKGEYELAINAMEKAKKYNKG